VRTQGPTNDGPTCETDRQDVALEIVRREAVRSGRTVRGVLSLIRLSEPPTPQERLLLAALHTLRSPHAIMPHPCKTMEEWRERYTSEAR